jgi:phosphatidylinositol kinase/protein kinase (PI-3  family)
MAVKYGTTTATQKQRPPPVVFKESRPAKETRLRSKSVYGSHPTNWRLPPILLKLNYDLHQQQLASQLIYRMASILAHEKVPVWLCPYEMIALTDRGGIMDEAIPETIFMDSLKHKDPHFGWPANFFETHFDAGDDLLDGKAKFVESLAAYSVVLFLLQIKD